MSAFAPTATLTTVRQNDEGPALPKEAGPCVCDDGAKNYLVAVEPATGRLAT